MIRRTRLRARPRYKPADVKRYHAFVAQQGCLVCKMPATVHHVRGYADRAGGITKNDLLVVPLCPRHHLIQHGPHESVEALGHQGFYIMHGIDLYAEAMRFAEARARNGEKAA